MSERADRRRELHPAGGTLTFLAEAAKLAVEEFTSKYGSGAKANFIRDHILKIFYAFELMMAQAATLCDKNLGRLHENILCAHFGRAPSSAASVGRHQGKAGFLPKHGVCGQGRGSWANT